MSLTIENLKRFCVEEDECWMWTGFATKDGHPVVSTSRNKSLTVRRAVWVLMGNPMPGTTSVVIAALGDEKCSTLCIRPGHLQLWSRSRLIKQARKEEGPRPFSSYQRARLSHGNVKLNPEKAAAIRASSDVARVEAAKWGVCTSLIHQVRRHEIWPEAIKNSSVFNQRA